MDAEADDRTERNGQTDEHEHGWDRTAGSGWSAPGPDNAEEAEADAKAREALMAAASKIAARKRAKTTRYASKKAYLEANAPAEAASESEDTSDDNSE